MNDSPPIGKAPVRVLVVDDSAFMRFTITKHLNDIPEIQVAGTAKDGREALELIPKLKPDVITLDVEMPHLDGLSTLRQIMMNFPMPVVMLSSLTKEGAIETVQALTLGAVDFIAKPTNKANIASVMNEVAQKIIHASKARVWGLSKKQVEETPKKQISSTSGGNIRPMTSSDRVIIIGSSTGGPRALNTLIPELPQTLNASLVIIQHMPVGFTRSLAERLDNNSPMMIKEAEPDEELRVGVGLVAPGGFHMSLDANKRVTLNQKPPVHGVRPAVDVTMDSINKHYSNRVVAAVLTGMGNDGTNGAALIHSSGGWVIAEAEETCVVWGMPRSVIEAGMADEVLPLSKIARAIVRAVNRN